MSPVRNQPRNTFYAYPGISNGVKKLALILTIVPLLLPLVASAQDTGTTADTGAAPATTDASTPSGAAYQFQRQGIFDCNQTGANAMSVGALSAIGGAYVPVADAAVELNTGTLVYKECILREVVDREREAALAAFLKQMYANVQTGRNGNPMYVQKPPSVEIVLSSSDPAMLALLKSNTFQKSPFSADLTRVVAQIYEAERNTPENILTCPVQGDLNALTKAQPGSFTFNDFMREGNPACYSLGAAGLAQTLASVRIGNANGDLYQQWLWGRGFYPRFDGNGNVVTPASVVEQSFEQIIQSPIQQLQSANDIGQMIGALYAGVTTQVVGDSSGLAGLSQSVGGQPSYLDQVAKESSQGLQGAADNAALQILNASQQVESAYYQAMSAIGTSLTQSADQLKKAEAQCWVALIPKVCATPLAADNTCIAPPPSCSDPDQGCGAGPILKVATSTAFSDAVISSQITPFVGPAVANIQASQTALQLLSNLIQGITNTASLDAQRVALQQLDTLVSQHKLHTQTDLTTAVQQQSAVASNMGTLLQKTAQTWGGSGTDGGGNISWDGTTNPGNGWCNLNNSATIQAWIAKWTKK